MLPVFVNKIITKGRCLTLAFLEKEVFPFGDKLQNLGLQPFCSLNLPIYPNLIKEFLSVAIHVKSGFKGNLRDTEVVITSTSLSDFLNISKQGEVAYTAEPREEALNAVLDTEDSDLIIIITINDL